MELSRQLTWTLMLRVRLETPDPKWKRNQRRSYSPFPMPCFHIVSSWSPTKSLRRHYDWKSGLDGSCKEFEFTLRILWGEKRLTSTLQKTRRFIFSYILVHYSIPEFEPSWAGLILYFFDLGWSIFWRDSVWCCFSSLGPGWVRCDS